MRDEFARAALYGMLAHPTRYKPRHSETHLHWHDAIASESYDIADAMVAASRARSQTREEIIEECANVCEKLRRSDYSSESEDWVAGTADCALAVRALAK